MNERIEQLKSQCWVDKHWDNGMWVEKHIDLVLFAELIVKECISELSDTFDMTIEEGNHLKEHFGVEE